MKAFVGRTEEEGQMKGMEGGFYGCFLDMKGIINIAIANSVVKCAL